jgi:hypothetical protein
MRIECRASGRIFAGDIVEFVNAVDPRHVAPIQAQTQKTFQDCFQHALLLSDGPPFNL